MYITKELFVIPNGENFILYAPLKRAVAEVNGDMIHLLKRLDAGENIGDLERKLNTLKQIGIVTDGETPIAEYVPKKDYSPTTVTLIPSLDCNLRCVYCYANAGEGAGKSMDIEIAKSAVDFVIENARANNEEKTGLVFHGGGEPFLEECMPMVKQAVPYYRKRASDNGLSSDVVATTNGFMNQETLEWLTNNFNELNVSLDGPEDIQNNQRPTKKGVGSFKTVLENILYLESIGFEYNIRATITKESCSKLDEIAQFFCSKFNTKNFTFEPLFECGRCMTTKTSAPDPKDFTKELIKAREIAKKYGKRINYSGSVVSNVFDYFCSSLDRGFFCVLPNGTVSSCLEVCRENDHRASIFIIGKYDLNSQTFVFNDDRIKLLRSRNVDNLPYCADCFAKYHCAGDCPSKCYTRTGSLFDIGENPRCEMTRGIIKEVLIEKLKGGKER